MRARRISWVTISFFTLIATLPLAAQVGTGFMPFSTHQPTTFDNVELSSLNVHFDIPVITKAGRGLPFYYILSYDSNIWSRATGAWTPVTNFGWRGTAEANMGYVSFTRGPLVWCGDSQDDRYYYDWAYHDPSGGVHSFGKLQVDTQGCWATEATGITIDGSGYTITVTPGRVIGLYPRSGGTFVPPVGSPSTSGTLTDRNGNQVTTSDGLNFYDTLSSTTTVLTISGASPNPVSYTYNGPSGSESVTTTYQKYTVSTSFGCNGVVEYPPTAQYLVSAIKLPDGSQYSFTYDYAGRIKTVTTRTGGQITYSYTGGNQGAFCQDGSTSGLTRYTPDGTWTYARTGTSEPFAGTTTVTDPGLNNTAVSFYYSTETQRTVYQGSSSPLKTINTCYNSTCTTTPSFPITQVTTTTQYPNTNIQSQRKVIYDSFTDGNGTESYGLPIEIDEYDNGSGGPGPLLRKTLISYASLGNNILDKPYQITVQDGSGNTKSQTTYTYDQYGLQTSGAPQHISISGSRGNPTTVTYLVNPGTLSKSFTYYDTGTVYVATDVNQAQTSFAYGDCGAGFISQINYISVNLSRSMTWDCNGGVVTDTYDENSAHTHHAYDALWRMTQVTDPLNNTIYTNYDSSILSETYLNFGSSTVDVLTTLDPLGRVHVTQQREAPGSSNFDSVETDYNGDGLASRITRPYLATTVGQTNSSAPATTLQYDNLGRVTSNNWATNDGFVYTWSSNDVLSTLYPQTAGENLKKRQFESDGIGRLRSVCELTSAGSGCGQTVGQTGYATTYAYDPIGDLTGVSQSGQGRTYVYDGLGRMTQETNPESGTTHYYYDSDATCGTSNGDLVKRQDAVGNVTCYNRDALHRLTAVVYASGAYASVTANKYYVYDSQLPNANYTKGRMVRAYTCFSPCSTLITDEYFSYSVRGEITDFWEYTPHSNGGYHTTLSYYANGAINQMSGIPGVPVLTWTLDGEGRPYSLSSGGNGQNPLLSTAYNVASQTTAVTYGSNDGDTFQYDPNTGMMTNYNFAVNGQNLIANLGWNGNMTLGTQNITDPFNTGDTQNCTYSHDDLLRISSVSCGSAWSQNFSYDVFGNIAKTGSIAWQPGVYINNRYPAGSGATYDANGNLTNDTAHTYTWDAEGRPLTIDSITLTYDAFGRMAEDNISGTVYQWVYLPTGKKVAIAIAQSLQWAFIPLPAGAVAEYLPWGLSHYRHPDWLGSDRLGSQYNHTIASGASYAPFGEPYNDIGNGELSFTGANKDTLWLQYDFMFRQYAPHQSRWISPDPTGMTAVDLRDPQSWNRYAYVMNRPTMLLDFAGLCAGRGGEYDCKPMCNDTQLMCANEYLGMTDLQTQTITTVFFGSVRIWNPQTLGTPYWTSPNDTWNFPVTPGGWSDLTTTAGGLLSNGGDAVSSASQIATVGAAHTPWYKNSCVQKALAKGAVSVGIDAIGLIPGGGAVSSTLSFFHGAAAVSNGTAILGRVQLASGIISTANGASNTSSLGVAQTALGVGSIVAGVAKAAPIVGQVISGLSVIGDFVGTGMEIAQCQ